MTPDTMSSEIAGRLFQFLRRLKAAHIHYRLSQCREDAIMVEVEVPGQKWEVEFLEDGTIDVERFVSNGEIHDETVLEELFLEFSE